MNTSDLIIAVLLAAPSAILLILSSNAGLVLLTLMASIGVSTSVINELEQTLGSTIETKKTIIELVIVLLPAIIVGFWYRKSVGRTLPLQIPAAIATGLVLLITLPELIQPLQNSISSSTLYVNFYSKKPIILIGCFVVGIVTLIVGYRPPKKKEK